MPPKRSLTVRGVKLIGSPGHYSLNGCPQVKFMRVGTYRRGEPGRRTTEVLWSVPGSQETAFSLDNAVRKYQTAVARGLVTFVACATKGFKPR